MRLRSAIALAALLGSAVGHAASSGGAADTVAKGRTNMPADGAYAARFCSAGPAPARGDALQCSDAAVEVDAGRVRVEVYDFVYRIQFAPDELDLTLTQGMTQVDAFSAPYRWDGTTLGFADLEKGVRYEVRLGARRRGR
ncbi:hypothetical protein [Piscinibacter koreensis]|uniref:Uncharacterized protein n=1 Tax=Piscinibacter koreensis TaxID=2742824 RepID=A0A7Y6NJL9_9BURK|nr:hypothetical protein [Schlegelella koreensis]NUZ04357.1 hypothetical protein [Schlegelella koreensis]